MRRYHIVLFNLGGPDSLDNVKPFLFNLFYDRAIINLPNPWRYLIAQLISSRRKKEAQNIYALMGGRSPIVEQTILQKDALRQELLKRFDDDVEIDISIAMRYWHPRALEAIHTTRDNQYDKIILLPLYPQFSTTTTGSSVKEFYNLMQEYKIDVPISLVCCYPTDKSIVDAYVHNIQQALSRDMKGSTKVIFSAHGLPEKIINQGDPYQYQVEYSVKYIVDKLLHQQLQFDHVISYQSRVGPMKWIKPYTNEEIRAAGIEGYNRVVVVPIAFVSEHSETLVELDIEYKHLAGDAEYIRIPTLQINEIFINGLADLCHGIINNSMQIKSTIYNAKIDVYNSGSMECGSKFSMCPCNI